MMKYFLSIFISILFLNQSLAKDVSINENINLEFVCDLEKKIVKNSEYNYQTFLGKDLNEKGLDKLKQAVFVKLEAIKSKVKDYEMIKKYPVLEKITMQQIQDNINFLQARDLHEHWNDCVDFNRKLDETRNQGPFEKINPEFANYV